MLKTISALLFITLSATQVMADEMQTRFGKLTATDRFAKGDAILRLNGKQIQPKVEGNNGLSFVKVFQIGDSDAVLVQNDGGNGCPATYYLLTLSAKSTTVSPEFGSCSDLVETQQNGPQITVTMPGFASARDEAKMSAAQRKKLYAPKTYVYKAGVVYEGGKPVK